MRFPDLYDLYPLLPMYVFGGLVALLINYRRLEDVKVLGIDEVPGEVAAQLDDGISAAGAVVQVSDRRLLVVSLGLESRGHRAPMSWRRG